MIHSFVIFIKWDRCKPYASFLALFSLATMFLCSHSIVNADWFRQNPLPPKNNLRSVCFVDTITGYAVGAGGTILKTTDGGTNWVSLTSGTHIVLLSVNFPVDPQTGYSVGAGGIILKTTDGGTTWLSQTSGTANILWSVHFPVDVSTGYAVGAGGTILKTTDGGTNWLNQIPGTTDYLNSVHFPADSQTGYVAGGGIKGTILKTTDGGLSWVSQSSGSANGFRSIYFPGNVFTGYAVGGSGTIMKTTDGGTNWVSQTSGTTGILISVQFPVNAQTGYIVGDGGTILKTTDGGTWVEESSPESIRAQLGFRLGVPVPNPIHSFCEITFALPASGKAQLVVYDALGRRVRVLLDGEVKAGSHQVRWDASNDRGRPLPSGVYFLRLETEQTSLTRKVFMVR